MAENGTNQVKLVGNKRICRKQVENGNSKKIEGNYGTTNVKCVKTDGIRQNVLEMEGICKMSHTWRKVVCQILTLEINTLTSKLKVWHLEFKMIYLETKGVAFGVKRMLFGISGMVFGAKAMVFDLKP